MVEKAQAVNWEKTLPQGAPHGAGYTFFSFYFKFKTIS